MSHMQHIRLLGRQLHDPGHFQKGPLCLSRWIQVLCALQGLSQGDRSTHAVLEYSYQTLCQSAHWHKLLISCTVASTVEAGKSREAISQACKPTDQNNLRDCSPVLLPCQKTTSAGMQDRKLLNSLSVSLPRSSQRVVIISFASCEQTLWNLRFFRALRLKHYHSFT